MARHVLKIAAEFFDAVDRGVKPFEVRKDDRGGFCREDILELVETNIIGTETGRRCLKRVTYVLHGWGIEKGYAGLGLAPVRSPVASYGLGPISAADVAYLTGETDVMPLSDFVQRVLERNAASEKDNLSAPTGVNGG